ncbi:cation diffusion facilitator family transporter [Tissierella creatinophila]|uniref:Ferrous-iron efflux pump FieF n=1 Tax=Tissierella creatinophila DSM 6911 TaxID=1123403 RepID=A0A1U7M4U8_TISCR|nr:cation diffusion facilitator family transporter [Tissierella creatinophila]OLS02342.1 ferrous-iron efflux pump FieF [Tissierella creatinophila DSM 6911]
MTNFLIRLVTKNESSDEKRRLKIAYMASIVGIITNIILSIIKLIIGFMISSIGVIADGFNNVTDTLSSIITLVGFKLSSMPPDKEHPYGHGRIEYISGLMVAFLVMIVGFQFTTSSFKEIINPTPVEFELVSFIIITLSILSKIWLSFFNKTIAKKINSKSLKAVSVDALGDVLTTSVVAVSLIIGRFTTLPIDGFIGIVVSFLIIYNGYNLVKETINPLIGEAPSKELIEGIQSDVLSYKYITGVHDLLIHSYGENKTIAVIDAEFPASLDIVKVYDEIRIAERELGEKYELTLVIHMDPLVEESEKRYNIRKEIKDILKENPLYKSMHDFHISQSSGVEIIEFDMVIYGEKLKKQDIVEDIKENTQKRLKERYQDKNFNITLDIDYT